MTPPSLAALQRWLLEVVSHAQDVEDALVRPAAAGWLAPDAVHAVIRGPAGLDAVAGLGIYHRMYRLRLRDALETDFPALLAVVGPERFEALAIEFIEARPSTSWTLNRLGDAFPEHLAARAEPWIAELAALELQQTLAIQSAESGRIGPTELASIPPERLAEARFRPIASLRLLETSHDVLSLFEDWRHGRGLAPPARRLTRMAIYRQARTEQLELPPAPYALLRALADGVPLGAAIELAYPEPSEADAAELQASLADWAARGLFAAVSL
jgi:hypothetical protein